MSPDAGCPSPVDGTEVLCRLMRERIAATGLDLTGLTVLTEAATGAYATTPVIAALAGAKQVWAFTRSSRHGTAAEVAAATIGLARAASVRDRLAVIEALPEDLLATVDIVTNSGHLRPIDAGMIRHLPDRAVIGLMFEGWEFRGEDIDRDACRRRGIPIVAVNERHPAVGVFPFLGPLSVRLLRDAGLAVAGQRIAVLCDNPFAPFLAEGLAAAGAQAEMFADARSVPDGPWDAVLVSLRPDDDRLRLSGDDIAHLAHAAPRATLAQFWGDVDRAALLRLGVPVWPPEPPRHGHMAILLGALGPEPIVRLQAGGLRAAELVCRGHSIDPDGVAERI